MDFKYYKDFLIAADLYKVFLEEYEAVHTEKVTWEMLLCVPEAFCVDHYSYYLDEILQTLDKKKTTLYVHRQGINADFLVFIKWILFFMKRGKDRYYEKEISAIKADEKKGFEESEKKKVLDTKADYFNAKYDKLVSWINEYDKEETARVTPDIAVSVYREIACLCKWKKENHPVRPAIADIEMVQPVLIEQQVKAEEKKATKGILAVKDMIADIPDKFKAKSEQKPFGISKEEIKDAGLLDFQKQELSEYLQIMNILFITCSRKYFHEVD